MQLSSSLFDTRTPDCGTTLRWPAARQQWRAGAGLWAVAALVDFGAECAPPGD